MKRNKKGFTLAELLVVVAIIAVLVAIAIPIFNSSTKKAEEAVEVANARAIYAEGMVKVVDGSYTAAISQEYGGITYTFTYTAPTTAAGLGSWTITLSPASTFGNTYASSATSLAFPSIVIDGK